MGYQTVRALIPVRHNGVLRIPGQTAGDNAQDFVAEDSQVARLVALGVVTSLGVAPTPSSPSAGSGSYLGAFADIATLNAQYPASENAGNTAVAGGVSYSCDGAAWVPVSAQLSDEVVVADSDLIQISLNNSAIQVVGCGGLLQTIRCVTGASVVLTVIDNPFGATGRTIYTGTLSAGDVVAVNGYALHGLYASTPGAGSFEFDFKGAF